MSTIPDCTLLSVTIFTDDVLHREGRANVVAFFSHECLAAKIKRLLLRYVLV